MNELLCRGIEDDKKTPWFGALEEPARPGFYERRWWNALRYWDGKVWRKGGPKGRIVFPQEWRGMKTPNKY